jgi:hypothetical protein
LKSAHSEYLLVSGGKIPRVPKNTRVSKSIKLLLLCGAAIRAASAIGSQELGVSLGDRAKIVTLQEVPSAGIFPFRVLNWESGMSQAAS